MNDKNTTIADNPLENNERRSGLDRRSFRERRNNKRPWYGQEKRHPDDRRYENRRGLNFDVLFSTRDTFQKYEDWLDTYCRGRWKLEIEDIDDNGKKIVRVYFEAEFDQINFRSMLESLRSPPTIK